MRKRILIAVAFIVVLCGSMNVIVADEVTQWNDVASTALVAAAKSPLQQSRTFAMMHIAMHDALNTIDQRYETYLEELDVQGSENASLEAALAAAARDVLTVEVPTQQAAIDAQYIASLSAIPDGTEKARGLAIGQAAAAAILDLRASDGSTVVVPYVPGTLPGDWQRTPPAFAAPTSPGWGNVTPFVIKSGSRFRPKNGPPSLTSETYTADYDEVKRIGSATSTERTAEQTEMARFHFESSGVEWNRIARKLVVDRALDLWESARMFALMNMGIADAFISGFDTKYAYNFWRPVTAIRAGDTDGNPVTIGDPSWISLIATPPHPDYTSTHSVASGAASKVLERFFKTDDIVFSATSGSLPGVTRSFSSFSAAAEEVGRSRVYAGIHFTSACQDGLYQGQRVGGYVARHSLKAIEE